MALLLLFYIYFCLLHSHLSLCLNVCEKLVHLCLILSMPVILIQFYDFWINTKTHRNANSVPAKRLTPYSRVLYEKLTVREIVKKFISLCRTVRFIFNQTKIFNSLYPEPRDFIHASPSYSLRSISVLPYHIHLGPQSGFFPSGFPTRTMQTFQFSPHTYPLLDNINRFIWYFVDRMSLCITIT